MRDMVSDLREQRVVFLFLHPKTGWKSNFCSTRSNCHSGNQRIAKVQVQNMIPGKETGLVAYSNDIAPSLFQTCTGLTCNIIMSIIK